MEELSLRWGEKCVADDRFVLEIGAPQVPPLRYAPVGMTRVGELFGLGLLLVEE